MNVAKIQQELLKAMVVDPSKVSHLILDEKVFLTVDRTVGWILPFDWLRLDLKGTQMTCDLFGQVERVINLDNQLKATDEYRLGGCDRRYLRTDELDDGSDVYIDTAKLKFFDRPTIYQDPRRPNTLYVTEDLYGNGDPIWVGIVCPVKIKEEN